MKPLVLQLIQICTAIRALQIWMYRVANQNVEIFRIVTCITRRYVLLQTSTSGFILYLHTIAAQCQLSTYLFVLAISNFLQVCTSMFYVCTGYVLGTYWYVLVRTRKNKNTNAHNFGIRTVGLKHSILRYTTTLRVFIPWCYLWLIQGIYTLNSTLLHWHCTVPSGWCRTSCKDPAAPPGRLWP